MVNEFDLIECLVREIPKTRTGIIGIGDDAGVLAIPAGEDAIISSDSIVDGIDFVMGKDLPRLVGRKALAINLSDIAAMAARPLGFTIALGIPSNVKISWLQSFYRGMKPLIEKYDLHCLGGDISRAKEFFCTITILGSSKRRNLVKRSGARPGDAIFVTGDFGGSIRRKQFLFEPRIQEALFLRGLAVVSAMLDVSDGLYQDLGHILKASQVGAEIEIQKIPISKDARCLSKGDLAKSLIRALSDGEDFELVFTVRRSKIKQLKRCWMRKFPQVRLTQIGLITRQTECFLWKEAGKTVEAPKLSKKGFIHF